VETEIKQTLQPDITYHKDNGLSWLTFAKPTMPLTFYKKYRLKVVTLVFWVLLVYIIAALIWWFISLWQQNELMFQLRLLELNKDMPDYEKMYNDIEGYRQRKIHQYIGEGVTFLCIILLGAIFVYRATRKQIKLNRQQQNFMMAVTHELKTPIAITRLNLETLQKRKLNEQQVQLLVNNTLVESDRLNQLVSNILISSQLEAGAYNLHKQPLHFSELITQVIAAFEQRYPQRTFTQVIQPQLYVLGEAVLLQLVISNLIENAVKYTQSDITIRLSQNHHNAILQVADSGNGIADDEKRKIFEKFYRTGNEHTRNSKGTGLGLFICKKVITDHKGTLTVNDTPGGGATFTITLSTVTHE